MRLIKKIRLIEYFRIYSGFFKSYSRAIMCGYADFTNAKNEDYYKLLKQVISHLPVPFCDKIKLLNTLQIFDESKLELYFVNLIYSLSRYCKLKVRDIKNNAEISSGLFPDFDVPNMLSRAEYYDELIKELESKFTDKDFSRVRKWILKGKIFNKFQFIEYFKE